MRLPTEKTHPELKLPMLLMLYFMGIVSGIIIGISL